MRVFSFIYDLFLFYIKGGVEYARKKGVSVGSGCRIYIKSWGSEPFLISIGNKVTVTSGVKFLTHDGSTWLIHDENNERYQKYAEINVGDNVFIGVNSIIMPGVSIGNNVVIGAGTVVTKDLPNDGVYVGVPAKRVGGFTEFSQRVKETCISNSEIDSTPSTSYKARVMRAIELQKDKQ